MSKTVIEKPFGPWFVTGLHLMRSTGGRIISVYVPTLTLEVHVTAKGNSENVLTNTYADLSVAISAADKYIADNFEVAKSAEEKLKDAEARIAELEARLKGLSPKFKIGQKVTQPHWLPTDAFIIASVENINGEYRYRVSEYPQYTYPESVLTLVGDE